MTLHPATLEASQLLSDCRVRRTRRSGPGGQHRNKVETAVVLEHLPTGVSAEANERRSQHENHAVAVFRLRVKLALAVRVPPPTDGPSPLWRSRTRCGRISVNPEHADFPALLAEALDTIAHHGFDAPAAAGALGCTPTQLVKLLRLEPAALRLVNEGRLTAGLHALK